MQIQTGFTNHNPQQQQYKQQLPAYAKKRCNCLSRGEGSKEFTFVEENVASAGERKRRFIEVYSPPTPAAPTQTFLLAPGAPVPGKPRTAGKTAGVPARIRMPEAGWDARAPTDADELPFGMLLLLRGGRGERPGGERLACRWAASRSNVAT